MKIASACPFAVQGEKKVVHESAVRDHGIDQLRTDELVAKASVSIPISWSIRTYRLLRGVLSSRLWAT